MQKSGIAVPSLNDAALLVRYRVESQAGVHLELPRPVAQVLKLHRFLSQEFDV